jgi:hypothetical protein
MPERLDEWSSWGEDGGQPSVHRQLDGRAVRHQVLRLAASAGHIAPREHLPVGVNDAAFSAAAHARPRLDPYSLHLSVTCGFNSVRARRECADNYKKHTLKYSTYGDSTYAPSFIWNISPRTSHRGQSLIIAASKYPSENCTEGIDQPLLDHGHFIGIY